MCESRECFFLEAEITENKHFAAYSMYVDFQKENTASYRIKSLFNVILQ
jgi:hypothetical protein